MVQNIKQKQYKIIQNKNWLNELIILIRFKIKKLDYEFENLS